MPEVRRSRRAQRRRLRSGRVRARLLALAAAPRCCWRCGCSPIRARPTSRRRSIASACSTISASPSGTSTGTPATTCPATACCSRRSPRCSACALLAALSVLASVALFERLALRVYGPLGALGRGVVRGRRRRRHLDRAPDVRAGRHASRWRCRARARRAGAPVWPACSRRCALRPAPWRARCSRSPRSRTRCASARRARSWRWRCRRARSWLALRAAVSRRRLRALSDAVVRRHRRSSCSRSCGRCRPAQRLLRSGAVVYLLACVLCLADPHADGQQHRALRRAARRAAAAVRARPQEQAPAEAGRPGAQADAARGAASRCCAIAVWVVWGPVRETLAVAGNESTRASYYAPVERFLAAHGAARRSCGSRCRSRARTGRRRCSRRRCRSRAAGRSSWTSATTGCCSRRGLTAAAYAALAARTGGGLRRAARHPARSLERPGGAR